MISLDIPLRFEGIVTVECHDGKGQLLHKEVQKNLIVDNGWASLGDKALGDDLLNTCIVGRDGTPPQASDVVLGPPGVNSWTELYGPDCPDIPLNSACNIKPDRSICGFSTDNGGTAAVASLVDSGGETYWSLVRKRVLEYSATYFGAGSSAAISGTCAVVEPAWILDGWGWLPTEASYIKEIGFCSDQVAVYKFARNCVVVPEYAAGTSHQGRLWNRIVLAQSIGFGDSDQWAVPDIELPLDAVITVTLELRAHLSKVANVQVININGVPTTCSTRIQQLDSSKWWYIGFLRRFGLWPTDLSSARIAEGDVLPDVTEEYQWSGQSAAMSSSRIYTGTGELIQNYHGETEQGNWVGGIGGITHANFSPDVDDTSVFVTVFDPKIIKTDLQEIDFQFRYLWSQA